MNFSLGIAYTCCMYVSILNFLNSMEKKSLMYKLLLYCFNPYYPVEKYNEFCCFFLLFFSFFEEKTAMATHRVFQQKSVSEKYKVTCVLCMCFACALTSLSIVYWWHVLLVYTDWVWLSKSFYIELMV